MAPELRVLTQNLYLGADLSAVLRAATGEELATAVERAMAALEEADNQGRIEAAARLIGAAAPDLVGLQEVAVWRYRERVIHDWGQVLEKELAGELSGYRLVARWASNRASAADGAGGRSLELGNAILAREGLELSVSTGDYRARLALQSPLLGEVSLSRGWAAADGELEGRRFRFLNTHLEASLLEVPESVPVQVAQAAEVAAGPAAGGQAVVAVGDFNSDPAARGVIPTSSREDLVRSGFTDAWAELRPGEPGLTWRLDDEIVREDAELAARLDLVLTRGAVRPTAIEVLGDDPGCRTPSGRWISDHLAVAATVELL